MNIESIEEKFIVKTNHVNPPNNHMIFEEYFYNYIIKNNIITKSSYLPVLWTNLYISRNYGSDNMDDVQNMLDNLDRNEKYFTVLQYADGILQDISDLDIQVFCAGGGGDIKVPDKNIGYPISLLTQPNPNINKNRNRNIFASFVGAYPRNSVRNKMFDFLKKQNNFHISKTTTYNNFTDVLERSIFSLSPRGYGATSFRICESLQHGSIPVYVYDKDWIPWYDKFDFNDIGIKIHESEIEKIPEILKSKTEKDIKNYIKKGEKIYNEYFTFEGCTKKIIEKI